MCEQCGKIRWVKTIKWNSDQMFLRVSSLTDWKNFNIDLAASSGCQVHPSTVWRSSIRNSHHRRSHVFLSEVSCCFLKKNSISSLLLSLSVHDLQFQMKNSPITVALIKSFLVGLLVIVFHLLLILCSAGAAIKDVCRKYIYVLYNNVTLCFI